MRVGTGRGVEMVIDKVVVDPKGARKVGDTIFIAEVPYEVVRRRGIALDCALILRPPSLREQAAEAKRQESADLAGRLSLEVARLKLENSALRQVPTDIFKDGELLAGISRWVCGLVAASAVLVYLVPSGMWGVVAGAAIAWLQAEWKRWRYAKEAVK